MSKIKRIIEIEKRDLDLIEKTTFVEDTDVMFRQTAEDREKTLMLFRVTDAIKQSKPYDNSGDCISRSALKEQINATDFDFGDYYDNTEEIRKRVCEAIDNAQAVDLWQMRQEATENALKKARETDRWIPVSEKLPEPLISVIATDNNDVFVAWYNEGWKSSDSQFDKHTPIVAWRPIPRYTKNEKGGAENDCI